MNNYIIKDFTLEEARDEFFLLLKEVYRSFPASKNFSEFLRYITDMKNPSLRFIKMRNFVVYKDDQPAGHVAAFIDKRLEGVGFLGLYVCIQNSVLSSLLIKRAVSYLKGQRCKVVRAPFDLTIWHSYRFALQQNDPFIFEPISQPYYPDQFKNAGFRVAGEYFSGQREDFTTVASTKKSYESLLKEGYAIRNPSETTFLSDLLSIYSIASKTFRGSWSFVQLSEEEFIYLYNFYKKYMDFSFVEIITNKNGEDIGFCFSVPDPFHKETIILKTLGVLPEYQGKGIGAALLYSQHTKAYEKGYKKFIYALIRKDNVITQLPYPGASIIREYAVFEQQIL